MANGFYETVAAMQLDPTVGQDDISGLSTLRTDMIDQLLSNYSSSPTQSLGTTLAASLPVALAAAFGGLDYAGAAAPSALSAIQQQEARDKLAREQEQNRLKLGISAVGEQLNPLLKQQSEARKHNLELQKMALGPALEAEKRRAIQPFLLEAARARGSAGDFAGSQPLSEGAQEVLYRNLRASPTFEDVPDDQLRSLVGSFKRSEQTTANASLGREASGGRQDKTIEQKEIDRQISAQEKFMEEVSDFTEAQTLLGQNWGVEKGAKVPTKVAAEFRDINITTDKAKVIGAELLRRIDEKGTTGLDELASLPEMQSSIAQLRATANRFNQIELQNSPLNTGKITNKQFDFMKETFLKLNSLFSAGTTFDRTAKDRIVQTIKNLEETQAIVAQNSGIVRRDKPGVVNPEREKTTEDIVKKFKPLGLPAQDQDQEQQATGPTFPVTLKDGSVVMAERLPNGQLRRVK